MSKTPGLTKKLLPLLKGNEWAGVEIDRSSLRNMVHSALSNAEKSGVAHSSFLHNQITIDNYFADYAQENNVNIKCLLSDPIASWKSAISGSENFVATGIFRITKDKLNFLHCALFHKGNNYDDEASFFVLVPDKMLDEYLNFRNHFTQWLKDKDRDNLEIEVVGGEPIEFARDLTWDDVFLEEKHKKVIIDSVEGFLKSRELYKKKKVPWKRSMIFHGPQGTGKTTTIQAIISQYPDLKPLTIQPGHPEADSVLEEAFGYAEEHAPALLFLEDLQELLKSITQSHFLQLLDGVKSREGILVIATGNDLKYIEDNIKDRPRRFDKTIEFPLPNKTLTEKYLLKWFGKSIVQNKKLDIVNICHKSKMTYAHLQEVYFHSIDLAISNNREEPNKEDIESALQYVRKYRENVDSGLDSFARKTHDLDDYLKR